MRGNCKQLVYSIAISIIYVSLVISCNTSQGNQIDTTPPARREFIDTTDGIHIFNDQLFCWDNEAWFQFAATHYVGTQKLTRSDADRMRSYNSDFIILHYRLGTGLGYREIQGDCNPSGDWLEIIEGDQWVREWPGEAKIQDSWFFKWNSQRVLNCEWGWYLTELNDPSWRTWWLGEVLRQLAANDNDGLFADSFSVPNYLGGADTWEPDLPEVDSNFEQAWAERLENFIAYLSDQFAGNYYLIPNIGAWITTRNPTDYSAVDGVMIEGFGGWGWGDQFELGDWQLQMNRMLSLISQDKIIIAQNYVDPNDIDDRLFVLGCYLLIKGRYSYINMDFAMEPEWFPEYEIPIGSYVGGIPTDIDSLYDANWDVYKRQYTNGLVLVNSDTTAQTVDLGRTYYLATPIGGGIIPDDGDISAWTVTYHPVNSMTLLAGQSAILLNAEP